MQEFSLKQYIQNINEALQSNILAKKIIYNPLKTFSINYFTESEYDAELKNEWFYGNPRYNISGNIAKIKKNIIGRKINYTTCFSTLLQKIFENIEKYNFLYRLPEDERKEDISKVKKHIDTLYDMYIRQYKSYEHNIETAINDRQIDISWFYDTLYFDLANITDSQFAIYDTKSFRKLGAEYTQIKNDGIVFYMYGSDRAGNDITGKILKGGLAAISVNGMFVYINGYNTSSGQEFFTLNEKQVRLNREILKNTQYKFNSVKKLDSGEEYDIPFVSVDDVKKSNNYVSSKQTKYGGFYSSTPHSRHILTLEGINYNNIIFFDLYADSLVHSSRIKVGNIFGDKSEIKYSLWGQDQRDYVYVFHNYNGQYNLEKVKYQHRSASDNFSEDADILDIDNYELEDYWQEKLANIKRNTNIASDNSIKNFYDKRRAVKVKYKYSERYGRKRFSSVNNEQILPEIARIKTAWTYDVNKEAIIPYSSSDETGFANQYISKTIDVNYREELKRKFDIIKQFSTVFKTYKDLSATMKAYKDALKFIEDGVMSSIEELSTNSIKYLPDYKKYKDILNLTRECLLDITNAKRVYVDIYINAHVIYRQLINAKYRSQNPDEIKGHPDENIYSLKGDYATADYISSNVSKKITSNITVLQTYCENLAKSMSAITEYISNFKAEDFIKSDAEAEVETNNVEDTNSSEQKTYKVFLTGKPSTITSYRTKKLWLEAHPQYEDIQGDWKNADILFTDDMNADTTKMKFAKKKGIEIRLYEK